jgi:hypothetical protein
MNIRSLKESLSRIDEIRIISKGTEINGVICNVAALVRYGSQLRLIILEYDEEYRQNIEEMEIEEICEITHAYEINRIRLKGKEEAKQPFRPVESVLIGNVEFEISGSESRCLNAQDWESILFLSELLKNGWNPDGIDYQNIDYIFLTSYELVGEFDRIPDFESNPLLHFTMRDDNISYLVEQPVSLVVNGQYSNKLWFKNKESGEEHWAQINSVHLHDMWAEMEKSFSDNKLLEHMTKEQIYEAKKHFEETFIEICPKGMCYPIIEYECEESVSLQFYTKKFLDSKPVHSNGASSIGFIMRPEKTTGILGMKLKATIIQEPVPADTIGIEAELFQYYKTTTLNDIII